MANQRKDTDHPEPSDPPGGSRPSKPAPVTATLTATVSATSTEEGGGRKPAAPGSASGGEPGQQDDRAEYRPSRKVHIAEAGPVALGNWVGRVGSKSVRVYRGALGSSIPGPVVAAMKESGVEIGVVTYEDLGLRQPPATTLLRG